MHRHVKDLSPSTLSERRRLAVELRLRGATLAEAAKKTGLSNPTIISAFKAYLMGGWPAVDVKKRGRVQGQGRLLSAVHEQAVEDVLCSSVSDNNGKRLWALGEIYSMIERRLGVQLSERTFARYCGRGGIEGRLLDQAACQKGMSYWSKCILPAIHKAAHERSSLVLECVVTPVFNGSSVSILIRNPEGEVSCYFSGVKELTDDIFIGLFECMLTAYSGHITIILFGVDLRRVRNVSQWLSQNPQRITVHQPSFDNSFLSEKVESGAADWGISGTSNRPLPEYYGLERNNMSLTHLQRLEAESIHIMREVVAEAENPVMLYSIGKDSAVMLHLARKAFYPSIPPFPLLHVDTRWKFQDMYAFRDKMAKETGMDLLVHINPEGVEKNINPFTHGSAIHTDIMKTEGLKQALDKYGFDAAFGGARRDEEKSRAKERIFSFRSAQHRWDPKSQRPELWKLYNARKHKGESIRVFPLSNWTELDIWQYIYLESIPIVPLYYSAVRPVVERDGALIMVDDDRMPLKPGEVPMMKKVRFRTLGCYPLTGAVESEADTLPSIIQEMLLTKTSERQGRVIDHDSAASMEKKKQEGYF